MVEQPAALWALSGLFLFFFFSYIFIHERSHGDSVPAGVRLSIRFPFGYSISRQRPRPADLAAERRGRSGSPQGQQRSTMSGPEITRGRGGRARRDQPRGRRGGDLVSLRVVAHQPVPGSLGAGGPAPGSSASR